MRYSRLRVTLLSSGLAVSFGVAFLVSRLLSTPLAALSPPPDAGAGLRFQQTVAQILLRQSGLSHQREPLTVSADEINAFLSRHFESRQPGPWPVMVQVESGWIEVAGRTSARRLLEDAPVWGLARALPSVVLDLDVWVVARGRLDVRDGEGEFVVDRAAVGRQPVPQRWLWRALRVSPSQFLTWRMFRIVDRVDLKPGRLIVHTR